MSRHLLTRQARRSSLLHANTAQLLSCATSTQGAAAKMVVLRCDAMLQTHLLSLCLPGGGLRSSQVLCWPKGLLAGRDSPVLRLPVVLCGVLPGVAACRALQEQQHMSHWGFMS